MACICALMRAPGEGGGRGGQCAELRATERPGSQLVSGRVASGRLSVSVRAGRAASAGSVCPAHGRPGAGIYPIAVGEAQSPGQPLGSEARLTVRALELNGEGTDTPSPCSQRGN